VEYGAIDLVSATFESPANRAPGGHQATAGTMTSPANRALGGHQATAGTVTCLTHCL
jgi:hypothetical protein